MASMNKVFLIGNLTRDPELRYTPSGTAVADLGLAVNRRSRTPSGEDREETCFVDVVVWERQAETCCQYLSKGSPLLVEGRLQMDQWEKDGQKFTKMRVRAERTQFLGAPRRGEYSDGPADAAAAPSRADTPPPRMDPAPNPAADSADSPPPPPPARDYAGDVTADDDNLPF